MATTVTSASPIISAAAVEAVRPGLRRDLSRAIRPGAPPKRAAGRPTTAASGLTSRGASIAMPTKNASTPPPGSSGTGRPGGEQRDPDKQRQPAAAEQRRDEAAGHAAEQRDRQHRQRHRDGADGAV